MRRKLDQKTHDALRKLDAVESVTETRIQYSEGFRKTALERDRRGDSPAVIFREAGLDSAVIGYKRIERCMSRWRARDRETREDKENGAMEDGR